MSEFYSRKGKAITAEEWATTFKDKRVAITYLSNGIDVSTVWLGINHQFGKGPPLIFETMVFTANGGDEMKRYSTEKKALAGHKRMVKKWKDKI